MTVRGSDDRRENGASELLEKAGDGDFLRSVAEAVLQMLMEADVEGLIGAGRYERNGERTTWRNGHRDRVLDTRLGSLQRASKASGQYFRRSGRKARRRRCRGIRRLDGASLRGGWRCAGGGLSGIGSRRSQRQTRRPPAYLRCLLAGRR